MKVIIKCMKWTTVVTMGLAMVSMTGAAWATPVPLPFTYPYETLGKGELEDELYGDVTPLHVCEIPGPSPGTCATSGRLTEPAYLLQNEIEFGVTDHIELAWYQVFEATPQDGGGNATQFDGFKFRGRFRIAEAGELPLDVGLYLELETLHDEWALEEKVTLAKRIGRFHWMANLWVEQEDNRPFDGAAQFFDFVINPTTGITYEVAPSFQPGVEYWARGVFGAHEATAIDAINDRVHHFVGPTLHFDWGKLWWSLGIYADCNNINAPQVGEVYGPIWVRTLLGLTL
jgi:hypothetical protein